MNKKAQRNTAKPAEFEYFGTGSAFIVLPTSDALAVQLMVIAEYAGLGPVTLLDAKAGLHVWPAQWPRIQKDLKDAGFIVRQNRSRLMAWLLSGPAQ